MFDGVSPCRHIRIGNMETPTGTTAIVRGVPSTFHLAIRPDGSAEPIDVALAGRQHESYCRALSSTGLDLIRIDADNRYPDCCFVEDTAIVVGDTAFIAPMAAESRRGESDAVEAKLREFKRVHHLVPPAILDGGDVLQVGRRIFVGLSQRTNGLAVDQLRTALQPEGYEITPVNVGDTLHLKSACTYLGGDIVVLLAGHLDEQPFASFQRIPVAPEEAHAANCLALNGVVLIPAGAPETRARIEEIGLETEEVDISESRKAAGGLTCSSIVF